MAERITLVAPDGSIGTVPAEQAQAALEQGYRQPNQEERQLEAAGESPLRAGLEGLARGVIPGIDQAFINAGVNPKALQLREKANPWASGIGEFGGNVIQTLAVPEVSAEAGASKAAQFGASLVKPAVETGLMGLGQVVSESTLENRPLLGEDMASGFMKNALLGAGIGAGFKGVGAAARFARSKLLQAGVKGMPVEQILEASTPEAERIAFEGQGFGGKAGWNAAEEQASYNRSLRKTVDMPETVTSEMPKAPRAETRGSPRVEARKDEERMWNGEEPFPVEEPPPWRVRGEGAPVSAEEFEKDYRRIVDAVASTPADADEIARAYTSYKKGFDPIEDKLQSAVTEARTTATDLPIGSRTGPKTVESPFVSDIKKAANSEPPRDTLVEQPRAQRLSFGENSNAEVYPKTLQDIPAAPAQTIEELQIADGAKPAANTNVRPTREDVRIASQDAQQQVAEVFLKGAGSPTREVRMKIPDVVGRGKPTVDMRAPGATQEMPSVGKAVTVDEMPAQASELVGTAIPEDAIAESPATPTQIMEVLREPRNFFGRMADELAFRQLVQKSDLKKYGLFDRMDAVMESGRRHGIFGEGIEGLKATSESVNKKAGEVAQSLREQVKEGLTKGARFDADRAANRIESFLAQQEKEGAAGVDMVRKKVEELKKQVDGDFWLAFSHHNNWLESIGATEAKGARKTLFQARGLLRDEIMQQLSEQGGNGQRFQQLLKDYGNIRALEEASRQRLVGQLGNRAFGMSDFFGSVLGSMASGGNPLGAIAGGAVAHVAKDRGGFIAAGALDLLANSRFAKNAAKGLGQLLEKQLNAVPELFGKLEPGLRIALAKGGNALLQEHARIMRTHQGPEYLALLGLQDEDAKSRHEFAARAHVVGQLEEHTENLQAALQAPFKDIGAFKNPTHAPLTKKQFVKQMGELKALMMDPSQLSQHLPTDASLFPEISAVSIATAQNAAKYLISKAPKDPNDGMPPAYRTPWEPSRADLAEWSNYVHAVADPVGCLARALKGDNVKCTMDVLKTVYPDMLSEMQAQAIQRLSQASKPLTFKQRLALSPVLGSQVFNMPPQVQTLMQGMLSPQQPEQGKGGGGRSPSDGRQKVDVEKNLQTQAQRTEAR